MDGIAFRYPMPMYHLSKLGEVCYAANDNHLKKLKDEGWLEKGAAMDQARAKGLSLFGDFPKAVFGPNGQAVTVHDKSQLRIALKNGWTEKPQVEETSAPAVLSYLRAPEGVESVA